MKRQIFALLMLACAGCTPAVTKVNVADINKSESLTVRDMRPASEKEDKIFSLLITSKEYGVIRAGDAKLSPSPVRLLQHQAFQTFSAADHLPQVTVYHFVIYENMRSQLRAGAVGAGIGGALGAMIGNAVATHDSSSQTHIIDEMTFNSVSDEYLRGLYSSAENPNKASVYVIYVDTDIDGKKVFTRTVAPMMPHSDQNSLADAVQLAIKNHLARYGSSVITSTAPPSATSADIDSVAPSSSPEHLTGMAPASSTPSATTQVASAGGASTAMAQAVANQLGCGAVQAQGNSTYVATCGSYAVAIDCDGDKCRPTHTVNAKDN